jgi:hypothetical protein
MAGNPLFKGVVDRRELGVELGAEPVNDGDDGKRDPGCDQAILDGGGTGFILEESENHFHPGNMRDEN